MKASRMYHTDHRVEPQLLSARAMTIRSRRAPSPNRLVKPTVTTKNAAALAGGFLVTGQYVPNANGKSAGIHPRR